MGRDRGQRRAAASPRQHVQPASLVQKRLCCVSPVPIDHSDLVADLLKELSNHNERVEERKGALLELLKVTREDSLGVWEEHFKTILLLLLETLGDKDVRLLFCFPFRGAGAALVMMLSPLCCWAHGLQHSLSELASEPR